jgi:hypothetical protein
MCGTITVRISQYFTSRDPRNVDIIHSKTPDKMLRWCDSDALQNIENFSEKCPTNVRHNLLRDARQNVVRVHREKPTKYRHNCPSGVRKISKMLTMRHQPTRRDILPWDADRPRLFNLRRRKNYRHNLPRGPWQNIVKIHRVTPNKLSKLLTVKRTIKYAENKPRGARTNIEIIHRDMHLRPHGTLRPASCEELNCLQCTEFGTERLKGNLSVDVDFLQLVPAEPVLTPPVNVKFYYKERDYSITWEVS